MRIACIYHDHCWDGVGAAWIVQDFYRKLDIKVYSYPGIYQQDPNYEQLAFYDKIYIVDFSYPPEILDKLAKNSSIVILDHHASAIKMLVGYQNPEVEVTFNVYNTQSGIGVTWEHFYSGAFVLPKALAYIQDRDIWAWELKETKNFTAALQQYPITLESMQEVMRRSTLKMIQEGALINTVLSSQIEKVLKSSYFISFEGFQNIPCINCPPFLISEALNILAKDVPFAVGWYYEGSTQQLKYSLRSSELAEDVSILAKKRGGGGHKHAAGFTVPFTWDQ